MCFSSSFVNRTKHVIDQSDEHTQAAAVTFSQSTNKDEITKKSEALIMDIVKQSDGILCSLDEAAARLMYVDNQHRRRVPWNCDLLFGTTFAVKIAAYIYVSYIWNGFVFVDDFSTVIDLIFCFCKLLINRLKIKAR